MEPLVQTIACPNCSEMVLAFANGRGVTCESCGFDTEVFADRAVAIDRFRRYSADSATIVTDPVRLGKSRWALAHTRMMLV